MHCSLSSNSRLESGVASFVSHLDVGSRVGMYAFMHKDCLCVPQIVVCVHFAVQLVFNALYSDPGLWPGLIFPNTEVYF